MAHEALTELFEGTAWGDRDALDVDLPPGTGDVVPTTLQEVRLDGVVFVTTPFHVAVTDTVRSLDLFRENDVPEEAVDLRGVPADERHDRVREASDAADPGDEFALVSDRSAPVRSFLAALSERADGPDDLDPFAVGRANPETRVLRTVRP